MPATGARKSGYLPSLDGWRAIAILGVLMLHDQVWSVGGHTNKSFKDLGGQGVWLFFAISGVLICWRILEEEASVGTFHLRAFYVRRLFRIQPAAWAYLAVIAVLMLCGVIHERWHFWLGALFLYQNFTWHQQEMTRMLQQGWFTGHFWTLSVEEHFYILLSLFLHFCKRHRALLLAAFLLALHLGQAWAVRHGHLSLDVSVRRTYWQIQFLLLPALLALLLRTPSVYSAAVRWLRPWVTFLLTMAVVAAHHLRNAGGDFHPASILLQEHDAISFCFGFWVVATMLHPASWTTRLLETKPLRYAGRLSYSIYLWHLIFFAATTPLPGITWAPLIAVGNRPWRYAGILVTAMLSYHLLEKPMMRLGHKLAPPATPGHSDLQAGITQQELT